MLARSIADVVDEWEVVNGDIVISIAIDWCIIVATLEANIAFKEAIIEIKDAILLDAGSRADEANVFVQDIYTTILLVVINTHRESTVISNSNTVWVIDLAIDKCNVSSSSICE